MNRDKTPKWFLTFLGVFFIFVIIGTLAHEVGHYIVAVIYGVPSRISYVTTFYYGPLTTDQRFWFLMGGPISSWLVSIIGTIVLLGKYRHMHGEKDQSIGFGMMISILANSFCIRFIFNAVWYLINTTLLGKPSWTDEFRIARGYLGISPDFLMYGSAVISLIFIFIAYYCIPRFQRYIVLIGGIIGGILGYLFWNYWVGPIFLPY